MHSAIEILATLHVNTGFYYKISSSLFRTCSKCISDELLRKTVEVHEGVKTHKSIFKDADVHQPTITLIVYKWMAFSSVATLPKSGHPANITIRAHGEGVEKNTQNISAKISRKI